MAQWQTQSGGKRFPAFVSLLAVSLIGMIGISVVVAVLVFGLNSSRDSFAMERAGKAKELAIACVENSLESIRASTAYLGTANLTLSPGICTSTVSDLGGESRQIISTGTVGTVIRRLTVVIAAINPNIIISSWQETP